MVFLPSPFFTTPSKANEMFSPPRKRRTEGLPALLVSEEHIHPWLGASHRQVSALRSSARSYPWHLRNTQLLSTTTLSDLLPGRAMFPTSTIKENKHVPAKWLKIPRELVIKILVFDVYKATITWFFVGGVFLCVVLGFKFNLILLIVLGIEPLGFLLVILTYENCRTNTGDCQSRK